MAKKTELKITLNKSLIGRLPKHVRTAQALGLRRINQSILHVDTPNIRGMINKIYYLVEVEEICS